MVKLVFLSSWEFLSDRWKEGRKGERGRKGSGSTHVFVYARAYSFLGIVEVL